MLGRAPNDRIDPVGPFAPTPFDRSIPPLPPSMSCMCSEDDVRECVAKDRFRGIVDDCDADVGYGCMYVDVDVNRRAPYDVRRRRRMSWIKISQPVFDTKTAERGARAVARSLARRCAPRARGLTRAMVRFKNRYLVVEVSFNDGRTLDVKESALLELLRESVRENFGEVGAGLTMGALSVKYVDALSGLCVVRCDRERMREVRGAITVLEGVGGRRATWDVRHCGGTLKSSKEAVGRRMREILGALAERGRIKPAEVDGIMASQRKVLETLTN